MSASNHAAEQLFIGWAAADMTPAEPVNLAGQHYARISEGVRDPVTATVLALAPDDNAAQAVLLISCDLVSISDSLRDRVRQAVVRRQPALCPDRIILNATHTHTAPLARDADDDARLMGASLFNAELGLPAMQVSDYVAWAAERIADAALAAWEARAPGSIGFALGYAVVGRNRRSVYAGGEARMYGKTSAPTFSHIEGYEDHSLNLLATWDRDNNLTGLGVNVPCPSQETENLFEISADYWHDTRVELRKRLGSSLFVLPQCAPAGDLSPHVQWDQAAEARMRRLSGRDNRQELAARIADAVESALPLAQRDQQSALVLRHRMESVELTRRRLSQADVDESLAQGEPFRLEYERLLAELQAHPELRDQPRWYVPITRAYAKWRWHDNVKFRYAMEQKSPRLPVELHVVRLGDMAFATNPFEFYLDFGIRIKARSPATQTFLVQLAGSGSYVPSPRSIAGKGYGSVPASTQVGPEGGQEVVEWTLAALNALWAD